MTELPAERNGELDDLPDPNHLLPDPNDQLRSNPPPDVLMQALDGQMKTVQSQIAALNFDDREGAQGGLLRQQLRRLGDTLSVVSSWYAYRQSHGSEQAQEETFAQYVARMSEADPETGGPASGPLTDQFQSNLAGAALYLESPQYAEGLDAVLGPPAAQGSPEPEPDLPVSAEPKTDRPQPDWFAPRRPLSPEPAPGSLQARTAPERQRAARSKVERLSEAELIEDTVAFAKGRTYIRADAEGGHISRGDAKNPDRRATERRLSLNRQLQADAYSAAAEAPGWLYPPSETVAFTPVATRALDKVEEAIAGSEHIVEMTNSDGENQPMVLFQYHFAPIPYRLGKGEAKYKEFHGGRPGAGITVAVELPASVARDLEMAIRRNPASVRTLVEELILHNNDGSLSTLDAHGKVVDRSKWDNGGLDGNAIKPPYPELPTGWTITLLTVEGEGSQTPKFAVDTIHDEFGQTQTYGDSVDPYIVERLPVAA